MIYNVLFSPWALEAALRIATPLLLAGLGCMFTHYAGILNIALEGMMLVGSFFSVAASYYSGNWMVGVAAGAGVGLLIGLIFGVFSIRLKADFIVTGVALNLFAAGFTTYLLRAMFHVKAGLQSPRIQAVPNIHLPFLDSLGAFNTIFNDQSLFTYFAWILTVVLFIVIFRTPFGLHLRAAGEYPDALETAGVSVNRIRYIASLLCGLLCGLAGTHLALGYLDQYVINITSGRGFIALAAVLFANGNPVGILAASSLFGLAESLAIRFQGLGVPGYFALMLPYVVTILALVFFSIRARRRARLNIAEVKLSGQAVTEGR